MEHTTKNDTNIGGKSNEHSTRHLRRQLCAGESLEKLPRDLSDKWWKFFEEVEKSMGLEFIERHWDNLVEADLYRDHANFREGFRLGVSLMLELL